MIRGLMDEPSLSTSLSLMELTMDVLEDIVEVFVGEILPEYQAVDHECW